MQIIFGEKCVLLLRLFFAAVLMLWCAQTAAYSGQCHTTQGNPYIGVNFGVKTLEEEENTAGVVKDKFYQWNESNDYYVSAAFAGPMVEKNIKKSALVSMVCFVVGFASRRMSRYARFNAEQVTMVLAPL